LEYVSADPIRPEQVRTLEIGYRASFGNKLFADFGYYFSQYNRFIGYIIGLDVQFDQSMVGLPKSVEAFRYAANSTNSVTTQGLSVGMNYYLTDELSFSGNYSWNQLRKSNEDDPIIPAFNTPEHKFNVGFNARGLKLNNSPKVEWGCGANYKWIQGFLFEGSPQFTGLVPTYDVIDAQMNCIILKANTTVKLGCSNLLNKLNLQTYGGPLVGRMAYLQLTYEL
jgi:outer membrane receptor protein involved in Fe transport